MDKQEFLKKYPELSDNGDISIFKLNLLREYIPYMQSDSKIKKLLEDYSLLIKNERRNSKIKFILNQ